MNIEELFNFKGKTVILIGAAGLLGKRYAEGFCQANANIVLVDKDYKMINEMYRSLRKKYSAEILPIKADITNIQSVKNIVKKTLKKFNSIDILFNNAIYPEGKNERMIEFEKFPLSLLNKIISVNVNGTVLCCQQIGQVMRKQRRGVIINVSSIYGLVAADQRIYGESGLNSTVAYAISKSAILNLTRYLASYWNNSGIRVNSITPGGVENNQDSKFVKNYSYHTMIGRMANQDEYTGAILFLASDASSYMTGANLVIDGGWTSW